MFAYSAENGNNYTPIVVKRRMHHFQLQLKVYSFGNLSL